MAAKTWYATNNLAGTAHQEMSETDPGTEATSSPQTGWVVGTGATNHASFDAQSNVAAASFTATTQPDGTPVTTAGAGDCLRSTTTYSGSFAAASWQVHFCVRGVTQAGTQDGRIRFRLLRGANADGSGATEITAAQQQGSLVSNLLTSATQDSNLTFSPGAFSVTNEYIFVQLAWERTGAGGHSTTDVAMRIGNASSAGTRVISADFTAVQPPFFVVNTVDIVDLERTSRPRDTNLRTWTSRWNPNLFAPPEPVEITYVFRGPLYTNPRGHPYAVDLRSWLSPITKPVIKPVVLRGVAQPLPIPPIYPVQLRTWLKSSLPIEPPAPTVPPDLGDKVFRGPLYTNPRAPQYHVQLRSAFGRIPPEPAVAVVPFAEYDWPNPRGYVQPIDLRTITAGYNKNLIGQDQLPTGDIKTELPRGPEYHIQLRNWTWNYNLNLIAQDKLPTGVEITALPPQPPLSAIQLRTWINFVNLALTTAPPVKPFNQQDWPLNTGPRQPVQIFTASYNKNLIGRDRLPFRQMDWPLTPAAIRANDLGTWISSVKLLLAVPFNQTDWPLPKPQPPAARTWLAWYNLNLIGKDRLPVGAEITALPPQPPLSAIQLRTWLQTVNLALVTTPPVKPFNQQDWPINFGPRQPVQVFTASYNRNLIGRDQLPVGEINTALPAQQRQAAITWINAVNLVLAAAAALPFNQTAWPLNLGPRQPDRSYGYVFPRVLIGRDRLPFRQMDWPLYRPFLQPVQIFTASYNRNLIGKDRLPHRQMDWPVPPEFRRLSEWIVATDPNLFVPPAQVLPRDPTHLRTRSGFEIDARGEPSVDHRGAGIDARGPSSIDRRGSGKSYRGRNES